MTAAVRQAMFQIHALQMLDPSFEISLAKHTHTCMYTRTHAHTHTHTQCDTCRHKHTVTLAHIQTHTHPYTHTHMYAYTHTHTHARIRVSFNICQIHAHTHARIWVSFNICETSKQKFTTIRSLVQACTHTHTHTPRATVQNHKTKFLMTFWMGLRHTRQGRPFRFSRLAQR